MLEVCAGGSVCCRSIVAVLFHWLLTGGTRHFLPCGHANLTSVHATLAWGFASSRASAAALRSESEASGVSSAQLHPPFVARFTLEVTGAES